jgi:hypothetical protein
MADQWEYKTETNCDDATLNSLGAQGWELVAVVYVPKGTIFYFKRRKP